MSLRILDCQQRSPEWLAARAGRLTGTAAADVLARIKTGEAASRRNARIRLAVERLLGAPAEEDRYVSAAMTRGAELEPAILAEYEARTGNVVRQTGFIVRDDLMVGCSLDGDVDELAGICEWKAPTSAVHVEYLKGGKLPPQYVPQVRHNLWVTGAAWCDFVSYDPRMPDGLQWFQVRAQAADLALDEYEREVRAFLAEVDAEIAALQALRAA